MADHQTFRIPGFRLEDGTVLAEFVLAYDTAGTLHPDGRNAVVYCSHFGSTHEQCKFLLGPGEPLDPSHHFVLFTNLSGNGLTSSPSNTPPPHDGPRFPTVTIRDNVRAQRMLAEHLGVRSVALVLGHSMGALQAFEWASGNPDMVRAALPFCGAARVSEHNSAFLQAMQAILRLDPAYSGGDYITQPVEGLKTVGRAWAPWAPTHGFYRDQAYRTLGFPTFQAFLTDYWETTFGNFDANNLMSQIATWLEADIGSNPDHADFDAALAAIRARTIVMPSATDAYFPQEDGTFEASHIPDGTCRPIPSTWGHWAGSGRNPTDAAFIGEAVRDLLSADS